ncbi:MAG: TIGR02449 family protein [Gammaproteobacteria bacterium]|nr:TIGR02449 family protein [Gammaproteobacteria bacterium]
MDLKKLEDKVDELIQTVERLRSENKTLRQSQTNLVAERDKLMTKTEQARVRVESMIQRLRTMEDEQ